jgi:hypothetical protein
VLDVTSGDVSDAAGAKILAQVLTGLLAADIAGAAARLAVPPLLSGRDTAFQVEMDVRPMLLLSRIAFAATVIAFLSWSFDARVNAERSGWPQRRARAWLFWAWVVPIADLYIPFQIMGDIWRAHLPPSRRDKIAWLPVVWWASWLLSGLLSASENVGDALLFAHNWGAFIVFAVAGISLIAIIQTVSRRRYRLNRDRAVRLAMI